MVELQIPSHSSFFAPAIDYFAGILFEQNLERMTSRNTKQGVSKESCSDLL